MEKIVLFHVHIPVMEQCVMKRVIVQSHRVIIPMGAVTPHQVL